MRGGPHGSGRRGKHHALALFATAALLLALPGAGQAQEGDDPPPVAAAPARVGFTVRGVPAEASAENAVIARDRAHAAGRRAAWNQLAGQLGITRQPSDAQIESMVSSIVIEEERITPTRYSGRITVNFSPGRVRAFGGGEIAGGEPRPGGGEPGMGEPTPRLAPPLPVASSIEAVARYGSFREWLELRRRLAAAGPVGRLEVIGIATDRARLRIGLRGAPNAVAEDLARVGILLAPPAGGPGDGWRLSLARGI